MRALHGNRTLWRVCNMYNKGLGLLVAWLEVGARGVCVCVLTSEPSTFVCAQQHECRPASPAHPADCSAYYTCKHSQPPAAVRNNREQGLDASGMHAAITTRVALFNKPNNQAAQPFRRPPPLNSDGTQGRSDQMICVGGICSSSLMRLDRYWLSSARSSLFWCCRLSTSATAPLRSCSSAM